MGEVRLRAVSRTTGANAAVKDGSITLDGFTLEFEEVPVLVHAFRRMVRELEWDVCEMAFTTYLCAREHGVAFTALPVFLVRGMHHGAMVRNRHVALSTPADLEGRRVGVGRGWTVTTGVWARGILADEHGVDLDAVHWVLSGDEHVASYELPRNVTHLEAGDDLADMVVQGTVAAAVNIEIDHPDVVPLVPDAEEAGYRALTQRGLYPINHLVVVRDDVLEAHPDLAPRLFEAFGQAKTRYLTALLDGHLPAPSPADKTYRRIAEIIGGDPLPYGIEPNRAMIERLIDHAVDQHVLTRRPDVDKLFAPGTQSLTA